MQPGYDALGFISCTGEACVIASCTTVECGVFVSWGMQLAADSSVSLVK